MEPVVRCEPRLIRQMQRHCRDSYPQEACGLLAGTRNSRGWHIVSVHPSPNRAVDTARHFLIDPALQLRVQRELREQGQAVIGHYHSHPNGVAMPSAVDLAMAQDLQPNHVWCIVTKDACRWFILRQGGFEPVALKEAAVSAP